MMPVTENAVAVSDVIVEFENFDVAAAASSFASAASDRFEDYNGLSECAENNVDYLSLEADFAGACEHEATVVAHKIASVVDTAAVFPVLEAVDVSQSRAGSAQIFAVSEVAVVVQVQVVSVHRPAVPDALLNGAGAQIPLVSVFDVADRFHVAASQAPVVLEVAVVFRSPPVVFEEAVVEFAAVG